MAEISKILSSREDVTATLMTMLSALDKQFPADVAQFSLGNTCAHYSTDIAEMEGLSRALWGLFRCWRRATCRSATVITAIKLGTDRKARLTGGNRPYDQRLVEWPPTAWGWRCCRTS